MPGGQQRFLGGIGGVGRQAPKREGRRLPPVGRPWALEDAAPRCESELHFMVAMNTGSEQR